MSITAGQPRLIDNQRDDVCNAVVNNRPTSDNRHDRHCLRRPQGIGERGRLLCANHLNVERKWSEAAHNLATEAAYAHLLAVRLEELGLHPIVRGDHLLWPYPDPDGHIRLCMNLTLTKAAWLVDHLSAV
jgi:hypothetical protein